MAAARSGVCHASALARRSGNVRAADRTAASRAASVSTASAVPATTANAPRSTARSRRRRSRGRRDAIASELGRAPRLVGERVDELGRRGAVVERRLGRAAISWTSRNRRRSRARPSGERGVPAGRAGHDDHHLVVVGDALRVEQAAQEDERPGVRRAQVDRRVEAVGPVDLGERRQAVGGAARRRGAPTGGRPAASRARRPVGAATREGDGRAAHVRAAALASGRPRRRRPRRPGRRRRAPRGRRAERHEGVDRAHRSEPRADAVLGQVGDDRVGDAAAGGAALVDDEHRADLGGVRADRLEAAAGSASAGR